MEISNINTFKKYVSAEPFNNWQMVPQRINIPPVEVSSQ